MIAAVVCGVVTGLILSIPFLENTSVFNIGTCFEFWVLMAVIIAYGSKKPLEAGLKVFVFFLISQPLVYLVKAPFSELGLGEFKFYPGWFV